MVSWWPSPTFLIRFLECSLPVVKRTPRKCRERVINPARRVCLDTASSVRIKTSPSPDGSDPRGRCSRGGGWEAAPGFSAHLLSFWGRLRSCLSCSVVSGASLWPGAQLLLTSVFSRVPGGWGGLLPGLVSLPHQVLVPWPRRGPRSGCSRLTGLPWPFSFRGPPLPNSTCSALQGGPLCRLPEVSAELPPTPGSVGIPSCLSPEPQAGSEAASLSGSPSSLWQREGTPEPGYRASALLVTEVHAVAIHVGRLAASASLWALPAPSVSALTIAGRARCSPVRGGPSCQQPLHTLPGTQSLA